MHLHFTEEESEYLIKEPFNWHVSDDAPDDIRKSIEAKLKMLNSKDEAKKRKRA